MKKSIRGSLKSRQGGFIVSLEMLLFATILVLGLIVGWVNIRDSVNAEFIDVANVIESSITFPYFSDPNRGNTPDFEADALHFQNASAFGNESGLN